MGHSEGVGLCALGVRRRAAVAEQQVCERHRLGCGACGDSVRTKVGVGLNAGCLGRAGEIRVHARKPGGCGMMSWHALAGRAQACGPDAEGVQGVALHANHALVAVFRFGLIGGRQAARAGVGTVRGRSSVCCPRERAG